MKRRRSLNRREQSDTLLGFIKRKNMTQKELCDWLLNDHGIMVTSQYMNDVIRMRKPAGPKFKQVFKAITGVTLVDGFVEDK